MDGARFANAVAALGGFSAGLYVEGWAPFTAELAVMGPQGAVDIVYRRELAQSADPAARRAQLVDEYTEKFANPYIAAEFGHFLIADA